MKRLPLLLALFLALPFCPLPAQAQLYIGLHGGITLPQGDYADSRMSDNAWMFNQGHQHLAGVGRGWAGGLDINFAMPFLPDLEAVMSADFMQSPMNNDVRQYYEAVYTRRYSQCSRYEMHLPQLRNIPLLAGVRYSYPLSTLFDLYGEALIGANLRTITDWTLAYANPEWTQGDGQSFSDYDNERTCTYDNAWRFAFRLGVGILVKEQVSLSAGFYRLGNAPLSWDEEEVVRYTVYGDLRENRTSRHIDYHGLNPTLLLVSLGFRLNPFQGARHVQDW